MSSGGLDHVKEVLDQALELASGERASFLDEVCAGDPELRREVESLLKFDDADQAWQEGPLVSLLDSAPGLQLDQRIGPYRVVRLIGEGGMGTVVLAVREDDYEARVAIKIIPHYRTSAELIRRFHNERQLLAQLEHPNIARILDGGTTADGQPYFVMEYVEGEPIDVWCERLELSIDERLKLFLQVTSAIQLAHRNLVVHRDLKPSNILVTAGGVPKLLDFGIAKRLAPETGAQLTRLTQRPMTVRYASPEQIGGRAITTASDIYSLGLLLYQLLTGRYPYAAEGDSDLELAQAIHDREPRKPSAAVGNPTSRVQRLAGDLDSIILKAMRKEPDRRYGSVGQLAEDIKRYLTGRPVNARRGTWSYRTGKFVRRNKLLFAAGSVLILLSLAFGVTATILWQRAVVERERAVFAQERSERVVDLMKELLRTSDPNQGPGEYLAIREILDRGEQEVETLGDDPALQGELLATIGQIHARRGAFDRAGVAWEKAEAILRRHYPDGHPELAKAINNLAGRFYHASDFEPAERLYRQALAMKVELGDDTAKAQSNLATILMSRGELAEAEGLYRRALELREQQYGPEDASVATTRRSLGVLYYNSGEFHRAEPLLRKALETRQRIYGSKHTRVAAAASSLGRVVQARGDFEQARSLYRQALEIRQELLTEEHPHVAISQLDLARVALDLGELESGRPLLNQALATLRHSKPGSWEVAQAESVLGAYLTAEGRAEEAKPYLARSYHRLVEVRGEQSIYARRALEWLRRLESVRSEEGGPLTPAAHPAETSGLNPAPGQSSVSTSSR